tara:strand:+ start:740 stop:880 length:141 start_codon:yes stop_codon:yes gene_type:complete
MIIGAFLPGIAAVVISASILVRLDLINSFCINFSSLVCSLAYPPLS